METAFAQLQKLSFNVTDIAVAERTWKDQNINRYPDGRDTNILSITLSGEKNFWQADSSRLIKSLSAPAAALIAQGTPYLSQTCAADNGGTGKTICIKFKLMNDSGEIIRLSDGLIFWDSAAVTPLLQQFRHVLNDYLQPSVNYISLKNGVLQVINSLITQLPQKNSIPAQLQFLQPAIDLIRQNPCDKISVTELARLCLVSESYFRASFRRFSGGISVTEYRNKLRIEKAQELLDSSLWTNSMVAEQLGFYDVSHFYRVYKKITGALPKKKSSDW